MMYALGIMTQRDEREITRQREEKGEERAVSRYYNVLVWVEDGKEGKEREIRRVYANTLDEAETWAKAGFGTSTDLAGRTLEGPKKKVLGISYGGEKGGEMR